jgi:hypothetical protein
MKRIISHLSKDDRHLRALARTDRVKAEQMKGVASAVIAVLYENPTTTSKSHWDIFGF